MFNDSTLHFTGLDSLRFSASSYLKASCLNLSCVLVEVHVSEHHNTGQEESCWVGEILASNVWCSAVNSLRGFMSSTLLQTTVLYLENSSIRSDVPARSETEAANQTSAQV